MKILVVDDSRTMRQLLCFAIKRITKFKAIEATDGADALKILSSEKVDLILADINMPVMDGFELVSLIRENTSYKNIPIIMITTRGAKDDIKKALSIGANAYLTKPIQTPELIRLVNNFAPSS